ncbi:MAG: hypothetical protein WEC75_09970 [Dehalococcoidia bacterium]
MQLTGEVVDRAALFLGAGDAGADVDGEDADVFEGASPVGLG